MNNQRKMAINILTIMQKNRRVRADCNCSIDPFIDVVEKVVRANAVFKMFLSCFHTKSINAHSVFGQLPDGGEELAIKTLEGMCNDINEVYQPGCKLLIGHEGHFYADIGIVFGDEIIRQYEKNIHEMISGDSIDFVNPMLKITNKDYPEARELTFAMYMPSVEKVREMIETDNNLRDRYVIYKAFLMREFMPVMYPDLTKSEHKKRLKKLATLWIQRYLAYKNVCKEHYSDYFPLSVLCYSSTAGRFGLNLTPDNHHCGMPWFNTLLIKKDGSYDMIKKCEAINKGYEIVYKDGAPWYFKE